MKNNNILITTFAIIFSAMFFVPSRTDALIFSLQKNQSATESVNPTVTVGDTVLASIMINTEGQEINAIDGIVTVTGPATVKTITTGGSVFNLWPNKPSLVKNQISFVGGSTGGVSGPYLKLFTVAIVPTSSGKITLTVKGSSVVYKNDGKGSKLAVPETPLYIIAELAQTIGEVEKNGQKPPINSLATMIISDTTPPEKFTIDLGQDSSLYDGKYFVSFYATDNESGINRYEVQENNLPMVRSGSVYVLRDQSLNGIVRVKAIDNAGNEQAEVLKIHGPVRSSSLWLNVLAVIVVVILIKITYMLFRSKRQKSRPR